MDDYLTSVAEYYAHRLQQKTGITCYTVIKHLLAVVFLYVAGRELYMTLWQQSSYTTWSVVSNLIVGLVLWTVWHDMLQCDYGNEELLSTSETYGIPEFLLNTKFLRYLVGGEFIALILITAFILELVWIVTLLFHVVFLVALYLETVEPLQPTTEEDEEPVDASALTPAVVE